VEGIRTTSTISSFGWGQAGEEAIERLFSSPKFRIVDVMSVRRALQRSSVEIEQGERWCVKFYSSSTSF
jgi:hypothetical protein